MSLFSDTKDRLLEQAALAYLNGKWLAPYGRATGLRLDSTAKSVHVELELNGETEPVRIDILEYQLSQDGDRYFVVIKEARTSRAWLTTLARERLCGSQLEIPPQIGRWLMLAL